MASRRYRPSKRAAARRRATVLAWVAQHGWICPGYHRLPHPSKKLTADHVIPRVVVGEAGPLSVLCRSCNSKKRANPPAYFGDQTTKTHKNPLLDLT